MGTPSYSTYWLVVVILAVAIVTGCSQPPTVSYQCADGSEVPDLRLCSSRGGTKKTETVTVTKYQCYDGSVKDRASDCPEITVSAPESPESCLEILSHNHRINKYGWLVISGQAKNRCSYAVYGTVYFTLFDSSGTVLTSDYTHTGPWEMPPGATYGFEKSWTDSTIYGPFASYTLYVGSD